MITIITGVPGMGKTALVVQMLLEEEKKAQRPLFVMGIPSLLIEHVPAPPVIEWTHPVPDKDDPELLLQYYSFPPNSILIVDEAQRVFRARSSGSKVPNHVQALETHRHTGLDIWLLTQKPHLIDSNVRELCGRHIHIRDSILGRRLYEWPEYRDVGNISNLKDAVKRRYSPPKEAFAYYKSAEIHTKQSRRHHQVFYFLALSLIVFIYFGYSSYKRFADHLKPKPNATSHDGTVKNSDVFDVSHSLPDKDKQLANQPLPVIQHPYIGFDFVIKGTVKNHRFNRTYYQLVKDDKRIFTNDEELKKLGYGITQTNDCSAFLYFNGAQIVASCNTDDIGGARLRATSGGVVAHSDFEPDVKPSPLIDSSNFTASPST
ncbi:zonular occludens toxin (Zot) [mine drainage metagenome]|uniref:Zonular occludens toxin (Zot) n=1 Tax=mine drainage metagenome TaxID=410659 RepID=A0A1J5R5I0_9ZZZZ